MKEKLFDKMCQEIANHVGMPYSWDDVKNRLMNGYPLPFKVSFNDNSEV